MPFFTIGMENKNLYNAPALIIGAALILASVVGAAAFIKARGFDNALSVTGSAKQTVTSDTAKWSFDLSRRVIESGVQGGRAALARDLDLAEAFLANQGIAAESVSVSPVFVEEIYKYGEGSQGPREFNLRQTVTVETSEVAKMDTLAKAVDALSAQGVFFVARSPEYFYSDLASLRVSLLGEAVKDARARAESIAESAGTEVGPLKSASSGVVQVLAANSIDISDYGSYDTSTIEKDVMVTVRATFFVE